MATRGGIGVGAWEFSRPSSGTRAYSRGCDPTYARTASSASAWTRPSPQRGSTASAAVDADQVGDRTVQVLADRSVQDAAEGGRHDRRRDRQVQRRHCAPTATAEPAGSQRRRRTPRRSPWAKSVSGRTSWMVLIGDGLLALQASSTRRQHEETVRRTGARRGVLCCGPRPPLMTPGATQPCRSRRVAREPPRSDSPVAFEAIDHAPDRMPLAVVGLVELRRPATTEAELLTVANLVLLLRNRAADPASAQVGTVFPRAVRLVGADLVRAACASVPGRCGAPECSPGPARTAASPRADRR